MHATIRKSGRPALRHRLWIRFGPTLVRHLWLFPSLQRAARARWVKARHAARPQHAATVFAGPVRFVGQDCTPYPHRFRLVFPHPHPGRDPQDMNHSPCRCRRTSAAACDCKP